MKGKLWRRGDIYSCGCSEKRYRHVHCPCSECKGRATDRSTELRHWHKAKFLIHHETRLEIDLGTNGGADDSFDEDDTGTTENEGDSLRNNASEVARTMETDGEDILQQHFYENHDSEGEQEMEMQDVLF